MTVLDGGLRAPSVDILAVARGRGYLSAAAARRESGAEVARG